MAFETPTTAAEGLPAVDCNIDSSTCSWFLFPQLVIKNSVYDTEIADINRCVMLNL